MSRFKVGDKVVVIDAYGKERIKNGEIHTIVDTNEGFDNKEVVTLKGIEYIEYYATRFNLANSTIIKERLGVK